MLCYLADAAPLLSNDPFRDEIPQLVHRYLLNLKSEAGMAWFMAGDLLGDHWDLRTSALLLIDLTERAACVAARHAALHGIQMAMDRVDLTPELKALMLASVQRAASTDASPFIRAQAGLVLEYSTPRMPGSNAAKPIQILEAQVRGTAKTTRARMIEIRTRWGVSAREQGKPPRKLSRRVPTSPGR
jgi:hypothetical protein